MFIKDILLLKGQGRTLPVIVGCGILLSVAMQQSTAIVYLGIIISMLTLSTISYDEHENGYTFLFTLPVERRKYVREKYLFSLGCCILAMLAGLIISSVIVLVKAGSVTTSGKELLEYFCGAFLAVSFILAFSVPVRFRFGSEKSSVIMIIIFGIAAIGALAVTRLKDLLPMKTVAAAITAVESANDAVVAGVILLFSLVLLLISEQVSERIMIRKEF